MGSIEHACTTLDPSFEGHSGVILVVHGGCTRSSATLRLRDPHDVVTAVCGDEDSAALCCCMQVGVLRGLV